MTEWYPKESTSEESTKQTRKLIQADNNAN